MNMPMHVPLPLQLSPPQRFTVPPVLRRALLCCVAALVGALLLWFLSETWRAEAGTERDDARAGMQKTTMQLTGARDTESVRAARVKRFTSIKTALENTPPGKTEWEQLSGQLSAHPHIAEPALDALPSQAAFSGPEELPVITLQRVEIEARLLHEESLLALDAIVGGSPAHVIPTGCSLRRNADAAPITLRVRCGFDWVTLVLPLK